MNVAKLMRVLAALGLQAYTKKRAGVEHFLIFQPVKIF